MEEVEVKVVFRWDWRCPKCGHFHEESSEPIYPIPVVCESCSSEFNPVKV